MRIWAFTYWNLCYINVYYINFSELQGFLLLWKHDIFICEDEFDIHILYYTMWNTYTVVYFFFFSASAVDDLQMKELQDQLEAETYFSVKMTAASIIRACWKLCV